MKKIVIKIFVIVLLLGIYNVSAKNDEKITVSLYKCVDGDTAYFKDAEENIIKTRFLAINTPESTTKIEMYGKEASTYTCDKLTNAKKIVLEYDENSDKEDKYGRHLVWVFVDGKMLQEDLLREGLAEIKYLYGDYEYTPHLKEIEKEAKNQKLKIWSLDDPTTLVSDENEAKKENKTTTKDESNSYVDYIILGIAIILIVIGIFMKNKK